MRQNKKTVTIIEPDALLASQYRAAFDNQNVLTKWYQSADTAMAEINGKTTSLIILEIQLPNHSGIEFLNELRSYKDLMAIPVILLTFVSINELGLTSSMQKLLNIDSYLYKPRTSLDKLVSITKDTIEAQI